MVSSKNLATRAVGGQTSQPQTTRDEAFLVWLKRYTKGDRSAPNLDRFIVSREAGRAGRKALRGSVS